MRDIAADLKAGLGPAAARVPTRRLPDFAVRLAARFDASLANITVSLGRKNRHSTDKAKRLLGWQPRPAAETVVDCARSLIARHAGLGTGTAYRNFPNKQVLAAEILAAATAQIAVDAEQALAVPDPWQALVTFFELTGQRQARERGLYEALTGLGDRPAGAACSRASRFGAAADPEQR